MAWTSRFAHSVCPYTCTDKAWTANAQFPLRQALAFMDKRIALRPLHAVFSSPNMVWPPGTFAPPAEVGPHNSADPCPSLIALSYPPTPFLPIVISMPLLARLPECDTYAYVWIVISIGVGAANRVPIEIVFVVLQNIPYCDRVCRPPQAVRTIASALPGGRAAKTCFTLPGRRPAACQNGIRTVVYAFRLPKFLESCKAI